MRRDVAGQIDHTLAEFLRRRLVGQRLFQIEQEEFRLLFRLSPFGILTRCAAVSLYSLPGSELGAPSFGFGIDGPVRTVKLVPKLLTMFA